MEKIKLQSGFTKEIIMEAKKKQGRPEFPKDKIKQSIPLGNGITQCSKKPVGERGLKLVCNEGHNNYVYGMSGLYLMRIGSVRSDIQVIGCLRCGERLKGGEEF